MSNKTRRAFSLLGAGLVTSSCNVPTAASGFAHRTAGSGQGAPKDLGTPAGLDEWFFETGRPAEALTLPPPAAPPDEAVISAIVASLKAYGTDTLGPPPACPGSRDQT